MTNVSMLVNRLKIQSFLLFVSHFLNFAGYYFLLVILSNMGMIAFSRGMTIPVRLLILGCLIMILAINRKAYIKPGARWFLLFSGIYIARIITDMLRLKIYHMDTSEFLLYFLSFAFMPLLLTSSLKLQERDYRVIKWSLLLSGLLLSAATLLFYRSLIGTVGRISMAVSRDDNYISPLALSYCGTLSIGIGINHLMQKSREKKYSFLVLMFILISLVPFFLGASRGSIFALLLPFILMILSRGKPAENAKLLFVMFVTVVAGIYLAELFGSSLITRFTRTEDDIAQGNSSAVRLEMWKAGLWQFMDHPLFGDALELDAYKIYPHNIIVEVLLSTGIVGFIPFLAVLFHGFKKVILIFRHDPANGWICIVFIQSLMQNMFSGSIYGGSWLWASLGLLYSYERIRQQPANTVLYN